MSLYICNTVAVGLFGIVLSAAFCNIRWDRKNVLWMAAATAAIYLLQAVVYFGIDTTRGQYLYPIHTHLTLAIVLCVLSRQRLWPVISVLTAYLCCQLRRWLALVIVAVFSGGDRMQYIAEMALTVPLLILLLRAAPAVRSVSRYSTAIQCQFGSIPALYYAFDYLTRVYTHLLESGSPVVVEFMPFVCCVAYIIFVVRLSAEQRARTHLEQLQSSLNLQVSQAVREIEGLRESQQKTRAYRHDLRHHLQYLDACLENGQIDQARKYIRSIDAAIEASRLTVYCENEAANLILSAFASRAEKQDVSLSLHACAEQEHSAIVVQTYVQSEKFFLQVVNDCSKPVQFQRGIPVTDRPGHGVGVRSICAIVERYGGLYSFSVQNGHFILRISL